MKAVLGSNCLCIGLIYCNESIAKNVKVIFKGIFLNCKLIFFLFINSIIDLDINA